MEHTSFFVDLLKCKHCMIVSTAGRKLRNDFPTLAKKVAHKIKLRDVSLTLIFCPSGKASLENTFPK